MPLVDGHLPDAGDVIWIDFGPLAGHEQAGRRPGLVVSSVSYNEVSSLLLVCPITRNDRPWPFKVRLPDGGPLTGFVLADQVRSIDPEIRAIRRSNHVSSATLAQVRGILAAVLGVEAP